MSIDTVDLGPLRGPFATQPWTRVQWPGAGPSLGVWDTPSALAIPAVSRAVTLIAGQVRQMPMDDYRGILPLARPRLLDQPDPSQARSWFVGMQVQDYLMHGNALSYVTARDASGYPSAVAWLPASWVHIAWDPSDADLAAPEYWVGGRMLDATNVVHVKRGADERWPVRGIGVVEQHNAALNRVSNAERYESESLSGSGVPSVAIITPNPRLGSDEAKAAKEDWMERFAGPNREPAILPAGTNVIPLAWSPVDADIAEVRRMGLQDIANVFSLDGYYLGAPASSLTYRSPGPMSLQLLRLTLEPILADFEGVWSGAWLPHGRTVRFDRRVVLSDDFASAVVTLRNAVQANLMTIDEARVYLGMPIMDPDGDGIPGIGVASTTSPITTTGGTS